MEKISSNDRFVRWQTVLREHLTNMNNLILTISISVVGFLMYLIKDENFILDCLEKLFYLIGLILIFISIILGLFAGLCRLIDFRATIKKIKVEVTNVSFSEIDELKKVMELYGRVTWILFYAQIGFFTFGIISLMLAFGFIFSEKLL